MAWGRPPGEPVLLAVSTMARVFVVVTILLLASLYLFSFLSPPQPERYVMVLLNGEPVIKGEKLVIPLKTIFSVDKQAKIFFTAKLDEKDVGELTIDVVGEGKKFLELVADLGEVATSGEGALVVEFVITSWEGENLGEGKLVKHLN